MLGNYRDRSGRDRDRAIQRCTELTGMQPASPFAYYRRAIAFDTAGEHDKAVSDISEALRLDPQYAIAYNAHAWQVGSVGPNPEVEHFPRVSPHRRKWMSCSLLLA
jgi:tetratricopeptide (TPR) repeat protein